MNSAQAGDSKYVAPSASAPSGVDDRATTFQPVEGGQEVHSGTTLLVEAYVVLWIILMAWLASVWRKQQGLHARLDELEKVLDKADAQARKAG